MNFELPKLPYADDSLTPHISKETIEYHYGKHHKAYVDNLNKLILDTKYAKLSLEEIIKDSSGAIFNNAAQVWNHSFYWQCLSPISPTPKAEPHGALLEAIFAKFNTFPNFKEQFVKACTTKFGSGWVWLVKNKENDLEIISTTNADTPLTENLTPLLTCDVWEHAYYIDYRNARPKYIEAFMKIINWDFVEKNYHI